jgi:hypothetical protein
MDRVSANFFVTEAGLGDEACVDLGRPIRVLNFSPEAAFRFADALITMAKAAERNREGKRGLTLKEVDRVEEAILGHPTLRPGG